MAYLNKLLKTVIDFFTSLLFKPTTKKDFSPVLNEKENEKSIQYVETENTIQRVDNKPISDEEIPYLIHVGYEKALEHASGKTSPLRLNNEEQQFFDELEKSLSEIKRNFTMERLSNGTINVYSNGYYVGKIKLTGRKRWMQILRGETQIKHIDGELNDFIQHIPDWVRYIRIHCK